MFFVLSKILAFLIKPFYDILLVALASYLIKSKKWKKRLRIFALVLFLFFTNGFIFDTCMRQWEEPPVTINSLPQTYQYAIILGGTEDTKRAPKDRLFFYKGAERITHAINLYKSGKVKKILFTGGNSDLFEDSEKDNDPVFNFYTMCGVAPEDIIIENRSRNTYENALLTRQLLDSTGFSGTQILVTSAFHMRRAKACYEKAGIDVIPFSADFYTTIDEDRFNIEAFIPSSQPLINWEILIKEWVGYVAYAATGKL